MLCEYCSALVQNVGSSHKYNARHDMACTPARPNRGPNLEFLGRPFLSVGTST